MKVYNEIVTAQTSGRRCHFCDEKIERGKKYFHMARNRHIFTICGKCLILLATQIDDVDPMHKADAMAELI